MHGNYLVPKGYLLTLGEYETYQSIAETLSFHLVYKLLHNSER